MTLVTLVVIGHGIAFLPPDGSTSHVYDAIYYVHIPAFVLLTGHLSRGFAWTGRGFRSLLTTLVVPYLVFEGLMAFFRVDVAGEEPLDDLWIDPHWPMWYLAALFFWRLATPVLKRHWAWVPASVAVSALGPLTSYDVLDIDRVGSYTRWRGSRGAPPASSGSGGSGGPHDGGTAERGTDSTTAASARVGP
jgi:hypothetical protein